MEDCKSVTKHASTATKTEVKIPKKNDYIAPSVLHDQLAKINDRLHHIQSTESQNNATLIGKIHSLTIKLHELETHIRKPWYKR